MPLLPPKYTAVLAQGFHAYQSLKPRHVDAHVCVRYRPCEVHLWRTLLVIYALSTWANVQDT